MSLETIRNLISSQSETERKSISVIFDTTQIDKIDRVAREFSKLNPTRNFSRNSIIESAVSTFVKDSETLLKNEYGIDINNAETQTVSEVTQFDLAIFPAHNDGFERVFLGQNQWYAVRISADKIPDIKYVASYRGAPYSGITHYAKVDRIENYQDSDKKIIYFKSSPIKLDHMIKLGSTNQNAMRSPRYTTLSKLLNAAEVKDLF